MLKALVDQQFILHHSWKTCDFYTFLNFQILLQLLFWEKMWPLVNVFEVFYNIWPYPIFVISFTQAGFSMTKFYTQKYTKIHKNTPKTVKYIVFRVQSGKFYTWQNYFTRAPPVVPVTNIRYVQGHIVSMHLLVFEFPTGANKKRGSIFKANSSWKYCSTEQKLGKEKIGTCFIL